MDVFWEYSKANKYHNGTILHSVFHCRQFRIDVIIFQEVKNFQSSRQLLTDFRPVASPVKCHVSHIALLEYKWAPYIRRQTTYSRLEDNPIDSVSLHG